MCGRWQSPAGGDTGLASRRGKAMNSIQLAGLIILGFVTFVMLSDFVGWLSRRFSRRTISG